MGKVLNFEGSGSVMGWKGIMALNYDLPIMKCPMAEKEISNSGSGEDEGRLIQLDGCGASPTPREPVC